MGNKVESNISKIDKGIKKGNRVVITQKFIEQDQFGYLLSKQTHKLTAIELNNDGLPSRYILNMKSCRWDCLNQLNLGGNNIQNIGCKYLSSIKINQLKTLYLYNNKISISGLIHLSKAEWKSLRMISLSYNKLGCDGIRYFSGAKWIKTIQDIYLGFNNFNRNEIINLALLQSIQLNRIGICNYFNIYNQIFQQFRRNQ